MGVQNPSFTIYQRENRDWGHLLARMTTIHKIWSSMFSLRMRPCRFISMSSFATFESLRLIALSDYVQKLSSQSWTARLFLRANQASLCLLLPHTNFLWHQANQVTFSLRAYFISRSIFLYRHLNSSSLNLRRLQKLLLYHYLTMFFIGW